MVCSTETPHDQLRSPGERRSGHDVPVDRGNVAAGWRIPTQRGPAGTDADRTRPADRRASLLTERDRELLRHLSHGRSTAQIAAAMSVSTNTARTRIRRVTAKLAVSDRHQVVDAARGLDLV